MAECESAAINQIMTGASLGACDVLVRSDELDDAQTARALTNRGNIYFYRGEYSQARADFGRAIALEDNLAEAWLGLSASQVKAGTAQLAIESAQTALEHGINPADGLFNLAIALETLQDYEAAFEHYVAAAEAAPDNRFYQAQPDRFAGLGLSR